MKNQISDEKVIDFTDDYDFDLEPADETSNRIMWGCILISALSAGTVIGAICYALLIHP